MNLRYALSEIWKHGLDRTWWRKRFMTHVLGRFYDLRGSGGEPVTDRDWDNLIVLDACRYDLFEEVYEDRGQFGELGVRQSVDSATPGFLRKNFGEETHHDTVYVSANPYVSILLDREQFHAVNSVWEDEWDEDNQTVMPSDMVTRTLAAAERYPDKKLVVHFIQPHYPFVGDVQLGDHDNFAIRDTALDNETEGDGDPTPFTLLERNDVTHEQVWEAYRSNLELVLPAVEELVESLDGRTAVTSDHGNALGEFASPFPIRVYGHPLGILTPELTEVPWIVVDNGSRKSIRSESPAATESISGDTQKRLQQLGYVE